MATPEADFDDYPFPLPGFRFHPTDEELVGFYLRRKVEKKAVAIELIKQIDIYKYNPWDLPLTNASSSMGEKEWYFFCKRGRKYKNSVRPNRVTGSGFWKATGIDKPIYKHGGGGQTHHCIGLKKTLVFYRGSAGRGTKTEWMMNEFRLPSNSSADPLSKIKNNLEEAEIWTLCRIFKRSVSSKKTTSNWREIPSAKARTTVGNMNFKTSYRDMDQKSYGHEELSSYISFSSSFHSFDEKKPANSHPNQWNQTIMRNFSSSTQPAADPNSSLNATVSPASSSFSDFDEEATDLFGYEKWEELKSIMEFDLDS